MTHALKKQTVCPKAGIALVIVLMIGMIGLPQFASAAVNAVDAHYKLLYQKFRAKDYVTVTTEAFKAAEDASITPAQKVNFLNLATQASSALGAEGAAQAIAAQKMILADKAIDNADKVVAFDNLSQALLLAQAGRDLQDMNPQPSEEALLEALKLPDLSSQDQAQAQLQIGLFYQQAQRYKEARERYQKVLGLDAHFKVLAQAHKGIAEIEAIQDHMDQAIAYARAHDVDMIDFMSRFGTLDEATKEAQRILDDPNADETARWLVFIYKLPTMNYRATDWDETLAMGKQYMPAFAATDPKRGYALYRKFSTAAKTNSHEYVLWAAPYVLATPDLKDNVYCLVQSAVLDALAAKDRTTDLSKLATALTTDEHADAALKAKAGLVSAYLPQGKSPDNDVVNALLKPLDNKQKVTAIQDASSTLLRARMDDAARHIFAFKDRLLVEPVRARIICKFKADGPFDIGSWLASDLLKDVSSSGQLDRPYGNNLRFLLETDASTPGRGADMATDKDTGDRRTEFNVSCNVDGIFLFFNASDTHVDEVASGQLRGGSYEMYLAPGDHQPYYTFLARLPAGAVNATGFITMYPNARYRNLTSEDNRFSAETHRVKAGFATCIFMSWEAFYDKLPANGDAWQFDAIRWTRSGGLSFGGSKSVHNRSSWGDIVFEGMTPQNMMMIKRKIIFSAMTRYAIDKRVTGIAGNWEDPELGDPAFYKAMVKPLLDQLDQYVVPAGNTLSAAEVDRIFSEAVPGWMELPYRLANMRSQWLNKKLLGQDMP